MLTPQTKAKVQLFKLGYFDLLGLHPKQIEALKVLHYKETTIDALLFGGGAGGGKSWLLCFDEIMSCLAFPETKGFIGRNELKRLMQSTYVTFLKVAKSLDLRLNDDFKLDGKYNVIRFSNGSTIDLLDVSYQPSDPLYERFGSLEYTRGKLEETGEIDFGAFDVLLTRIGRHLNKELGIKKKMLCTANPKKNWNYKYFYKPFKDGTIDSYFHFIQSLVTDNPDIDPDYIEGLKRTKDKSKRERLLFGNWDYDDDPSRLCEYEKILDLWTNSFVECGNKYITSDIAGRGSDKFVIFVWDGWRLIDYYTEEKSNGKGIIKAIERLALKHKVPQSNIIYDADGIGGGLSGWLANAKEFINNSSPIKNKKGDNFQNLKAQCVFHASEIINESKAYISCNMSEVDKECLAEELDFFREKNQDKDGKKNIMSKEDIKNNIGRSPDFSDTFMMRAFFDIKPNKGGFVGYIKP